MPEIVHQGRAIKRIREILHIKQDAIANDLNITQQAVSLLENKETIDPETLEQIAKTMGVAVEAIKNYSDEAAVSIIQNNYEGSNPSATNVGPSQYMNYQCTFNPLDKLMEALDEIKRLNAALIKEKDEKIALLERLAGEKKK